MKYRIQDWAGSILDYKGYFQPPHSGVVPMKFKSFDDAWEWIDTNAVADEDGETDMEAVEIKDGE